MDLTLEELQAERTILKAALHQAQERAIWFEAKAQIAAQQCTAASLECIRLKGIIRADNKVSCPSSSVANAYFAETQPE